MRWSDSPAPAGYTAIDPEAGRRTEGGAIIIVGSERPPSAWWSVCQAEHVALVMTGRLSCSAFERIRELALDGHRALRLLVFTDAALARRTRLPGELLSVAAA